MNRRKAIGHVMVPMIAGMAAGQTPSGNPPNTFLELKTWRLHNSSENQADLLADYLQTGLTPALNRNGAALIGAFSNLIGPDGPYYVSLAQYPSLAAFQESVAHLASDTAHLSALKKLPSGSAFPFVRVESSLLRSFDGFPAAALPDKAENHLPRVFEMRTYESQSYETLARKIAMFNQGESQIFARLKMRPVFFGETIVGPRQPNLTYMLSYDDLAARQGLWQSFAADPAWKELSSHPDLKDSLIVANISNVMLSPLSFSLIR